MTSQRQQRQDHYDHILPFIQESADEYYGGNLDRGFRHWAFATVFGLGHDISGNDIVDWTAIDGSDDFEIDGFFIQESEDDRVVHLFQSKHRQPSTSMGVSELSKFLQAPVRILNPGEVAASNNQHTKDLHDQVMEMLKSEGGAPVSINLVWATSGYLTSSTRRFVDDNGSSTITPPTAGNPVEVRVTLDCWTMADLYQESRDQLESDSPTSNCNINFFLEDGTYHQTGTDGQYKTLYMTVPVKNIIDLFARHRFKIFQHNPRGPLGNKINTRIKQTLLEPDNRARFHLLNNGITAICDYYTLEENALHVEDFQIINGCQTTVTLWNARAVIQNDPGVLVHVKLTECPVHFSKTIAETTNTQAALKPEDSTSNETVHIRLKDEFAALAPPWFYQKKRGEWSKMLAGPAEKERYREADGTFRQLTSRQVAQAVVAFSGFPGEAKDKIRDFLNKESLSPVAREEAFDYGRIYTDDVTAAQLLLPSVIQRRVWKRVSQDKERFEWLEYARYHLVWLIGKVLREHYRQQTHLFPTGLSLKVLVTIDDWFEPIYRLGLATINSTIRNCNAAGQYREFFRSAQRYRDIETQLQTVQLTAENPEAMTANLPVQ